LRSKVAGSRIAFVIRAIAVCAVLLCSGCPFWDSTVLPETACLNACGCLTTNPVAEDACLVDCTTGLEQDPVPQECLDCVGLASCAEVEDLVNACAVECGLAASRIVEVIE
jgi:hypothetical protein